MKKLLLAIALLFPVSAMAQVGPEVYRVATPAQVNGFNASTQITATTEAVLHQMIRATCTAACYIWVNSSGQSYPATALTGVYLPADVPTMFSVSKGSKVNVIGVSAGTISILEMTR